MKVNKTKKIEALEEIQNILKKEGEQKISDLKRRDIAKIYNICEDICDIEHSYQLSIQLDDSGDTWLCLVSEEETYYSKRDSFDELNIHGICVGGDVERDRINDIEKISLAIEILSLESKFINLTPHPVVIYDGEEVAFEIPSSGVARVKTKKKSHGEIGGIKVQKTIYGEVEGLPEPQPMTTYIVSLIVLQTLMSPSGDPSRSDVVAPDTSPDSVVRDARGQIIGVRGFATV